MSGRNDDGLDDDDDLDLFGDGKPPVGIEVSSVLPIQERFQAFHEKNPWVYVTLVKLARDLHRRGRRKLGIGMLWEVLRWQYMRATDDPSSTFKLNDHYRSRYVRLIVAQEPDLAEAFELRALRAP